MQRCWGGGTQLRLGWGLCLSDPPPCALQSPTLMEGPQGTAVDSKVVAGGLPRPLWQKQLQVEEDFGDLLAQ